VAVCTAVHVLAAHALAAVATTSHGNAVIAQLPAVACNDAALCIVRAAVRRVGGGQVGAKHRDRGEQ
jgi:hypothetical protein